MNYRLNVWIRFLLPLFLSLFLGVLIFMMAQFREPPGLEWYAFVWFALSISLLWEAGWLISKRLDERFPWREGVIRRLSVQLALTNLFGILFFLACFWLLNWYENQVLGHVNPLGVLHVLVTIAEAFFIIQIINSIQISYLLLQNWQQVQLESEAIKKEHVIAHLEIVRKQLNPDLLNSSFTTLEPLMNEAPEKALAYLKELSFDYEKDQTVLNEKLANMQETLQQNQEPVPERETGRESNYKSRFLVKSGTKFLLVSTAEIAAFYKDQIVLLYTNEGKKYAVDYSLEELAGMLNPRSFFRINRQNIIQASYLKEMRSEDNQFQLLLNVPFPGKLIVSQRNVARFKEWLQEE